MKLFSDIQLLLASKSPRRQQLIKQLGFSVQVIDICVDEVVNEAIQAKEIPSFLAQRKSKAYDSNLLLENQILITADTGVVLDNKMLGKPTDRENALNMLMQLSGRKHEVYTGVCLKTKTQTITFTEETSVYLKELSLSEIEYYLDHYQYQDKAGSYAIQEWIGMIGVLSIKGDFYNVMGFPVARIYKEICTIRQNS